MIEPRQQPPTIPGLPTDKPLFVASQRLLLLDAAVDDPHRYLKPALFRPGGNGDNGDADDDEADDDTAADTTATKPPHRPDPHDHPWQPVTRRQLFFDDDTRRLCLTTDAGVGKSTALRWVEQEAGRVDGGRLALYLELRQLPSSRRHYLAPSADGAPPVLAESLADRTLPRLDDAAAVRVVKHLIEQDRLTLLVDAIDQALPEENVGRKLQELCKFLHAEGRNCRVVVAGRPYAVDRYWDCLFHDGPWRFAQVAPFDQDQQQAYLGPERYEHLKRLNVEVLAVPRALETIRTLPLAQLDQLRTASDVYWRATQRMLDKAFASAEVRRAEFTTDSALWLLSALAFTMVRQGNFQAIRQDQMAEFRRHVWQRYRDECDWDTQTEFNRQLRLLGRLNEFMDHAVTETAELQDVQWKNRSLQEFFAGLWMSYYASEDDDAWIANCVYVPDDDRTGGLEWAWRFAAEMPRSGRSPVHWIGSMAPLYRPGDGTPEGPPRSAEMLYRSWPTMQAYAAAGGDAGRRAQTVLAGFLGELPDQILSGRRGPQPRAVAEALLAEFRSIPPVADSAAALRVWRGSPETEEDRMSDEVLHETSVDAAFELACYQVSNEQYELFDPAHRQRRNEYSQENRSPAIYVSWYDAWAFCRWLGEAYHLPTDKQWEFACRSGTRSAFHYGDSLSSQEANFNGNHPYGGAKKGPYLERTTPVGSYQSNAWDLYDMHGNVEEWCDSWFDEDPQRIDDPNFLGSARVLRGGSWIGSVADRLRSAYRYFSHPAYTDYVVGFRVARALHRKP